MAFTSRPLKGGNKSNKSNKDQKQNPKPRRQHRKSASNPFAGRNRTKSNLKYTSYEQEEAGSSIFHELDPSTFPLTKLDSLWMASSASENCCICLEKIDSKLFGTKKRHCKKCGRVVCIPCSDIRIRKHRVCTQCNKYYLSLNNLLNQWYRTNRNINHSLCGYDSYTLDTCSSLKRTLFLLNHYHQCILLKRDGQLSQKRPIRRYKKNNKNNKKKNNQKNNRTRYANDRAKVRAPFDITYIQIKDFVDRLPKYDSEKFLNDIHHLKQNHFKKSQVFKIQHYQKNHQWELRAYSWKKIGKCDRWGCQYGIKDVRKKDKKASRDAVGDEKKEENGHSRHIKNDSVINLDQDIANLLNNMHVVLLHGVDDDDEINNKKDSAKELYDLLPQTPLSPHMSLGFFAPNKKKSIDEENEFKLDIISDPDGDINTQNVMTEAQEKLLSISVEPLSEIEWMDERHETLCYWLELCCYRFDFFSMQQNEWEAIQKKKQILSDILDYLDMTDHIWDDEHILKSIMKMIKTNLFRSLPLTFRMLLHTPDYCQEDDSEEFEDPHYPHLCYIYEIALMFVRNINVDDKQRKKYLGKSFIIPLTNLFASEDVREREYLKAILHGIYARNMRLRRLIRTQMSNCCFRVIYSSAVAQNEKNNDIHQREDDVENGISECLQLVCSIIQGLTTPIKPEYKNILYNVLIPLHKVHNRKLNKFHETLLACCIQFILKDLSIGLDILTGLLKYWPFQSASKSDMFLKEIVIIINTMMTDIDTALQSDEDEEEDEEEEQKRREKNLFKYNDRGVKIAAQIIDKLIECMISDNHCLAEKALLAFGEVGVQKLLDLNKEQCWSRILHILFDNRDNKRHWCVPLHDSFDEALDTFVIRDAQSVQRFENIYKKKKKIVNQFKEGFYENGYNPIYPNENVLFKNIKKDRYKKYKQIQIMANKNKHKLPPSPSISYQKNGHSKNVNNEPSISSKDLPKPPKKKKNKQKSKTSTKKVKAPKKPLPKSENFV